MVEQEGCDLALARPGRERFTNPKEQNASKARGSGG